MSTFGAGRFWEMGSVDGHAGATIVESHSPHSGSKVDIQDSDPETHCKDPVQVHSEIHSKGKNS